jgi:acetyltransferase-like isoleucine patch superfamily enzyme
VGLTIVGTGKTAEVISQYFSKVGKDIVAYAEPTPKSSYFLGKPVVSLDNINTSEVFIAVSSTKINTVRQELFEYLNCSHMLISYVSKHATVADSSSIGKNCFIMEQNNIQEFVKIKDNNIIWSGNHIGHHTCIGNHNFISSHVVISGNCTIGDNNFFGVNSYLGDDVSVGNFNWFSPTTGTIKSVKDNQLFLAPKPTVYRKTTQEFFL